MLLTEYHQKRNEQCLQASLNQPHVTQEEMIEQTLRVIMQIPDESDHRSGVKPTAIPI